MPANYVTSEWVRFLSNLLFLVCFSWKITQQTLEWVRHNVCYDFSNIICRYKKNDFLSLEKKNHHVIDIQIRVHAYFKMI